MEYTQTCKVLKLLCTLNHSKNTCSQWNTLMYVLMYYRWWWFIDKTKTIHTSPPCSHHARIPRSSSILLLLAGDHDGLASESYERRERQQQQRARQPRRESGAARAAHPWPAHSYEWKGDMGTFKEKLLQKYFCKRVKRTHVIIF